MPCATEEIRQAMDVWQPAFPATEYGGLVFVYMGPPGAEPLFPRFDIIDPDRGEDVVLRGMRLWGNYAVGMVGTATGCSTTRTSSTPTTC
jgi:hypothetical protein